MQIRHQPWIEVDKHLVLTLHEPWWGAWQRFGWTKGIEGIGVSREAIQIAKTLGKKIRVNIIKYGSYEITPTKAERYSSNIFYPRDRKALYVIPRDAFDRIPTDQKVKAFEKKEEERAIANQGKLL